MVVVPDVRDKRGHVKELWKRHPRGNLLVKLCRVLEALQMERCHDRELLHRQLFSGFLKFLKRKDKDLNLMVISTRCSYLISFAG